MSEILYRITWSDISSDSGWATKAEFDKMIVSNCISIGFIYRQNDKCVWIYSSYSVDDIGEITYGDRTVIPKSNIIKMEHIYGKKTKE